MSKNDNDVAVNSFKKTKKNNAHLSHLIEKILLRAKQERYFPVFRAFYGYCA
jgi:hypothetical protein